MPRPSRSLATVFLLALAIVFARPAAAAWPSDPAVNVPVSTATGDQGTPNMVTDGAGGTIIAWTDTRTGSDIYAQRINAAGLPVWTSNGVAVCTNAAYQDRPMLVADGSGGAIIAWYDARNLSTTGYDMYAQRLNSAGVALWAADGLPVCNAATDQFNYYNSIVPDGSGGAIIAWYDFRNSATTGIDIYAQRINGAGSGLWTANGVAVCNVAGDQYYPIVCTDGSGGAILSWYDSRGGSSVYAQRVNAAGAVQWTAGGVPVCTAANVRSGTVICADGFGGAILAWQDFRNGANYDIYAQRITSGGATLWTSDGYAVCNAASTQQAPALTADGSGGAILAWIDARTVPQTIEAQRMSSGGQPQWTANGIVLSGGSSQGAPVISSDGSGGAEVIWQDQRNGGSGNYDLYAQRVNANGAVLWGTDGTAVANGGGRQQSPVMFTDAAGTMLTAFMDGRNGLTWDLYAQRVEQFGKLGNPEPVITSVLDVPNDQGGHVRLSWAPSYLDPANDYDMSAYDIYHSIPPNVAQQAVRAGVAREVRAGEAPLAGHTSYLFTSQGAQSFAWEYVNTVNPAHFLSSYGSNQATTGDSVGGSNPTTAFMVVARGYTGKYWLSAPASGYSVDNIPPKTPAPFTGQYAAGSTKLHWDRNSEADLAGYKLYRGSNASFVPSAGNLVSTLPDTGYVDAAAAPYIYKLTAVDSHGNESPVATLTPTGTLGVGDGAALTLAFAPPSPNPARGSTTLEFTLPQAGHVRLSVFDAAGRRVQLLRDGEMAAGAHREAFALRDDAGRDLAAGLYLVRLETAGRVISRRLAAVR